MALLDDMRGELSVVRATHGRRCDYEFNVAPDVMERLKDWLRDNFPEKDPSRSGIPMSRAWGIPLVVDEGMNPGTWRVDWSERHG